MQIEPGKQYQMRNGDWAIVLARNPVEKAINCWIGVLNGGASCSWNADGSYCSIREGYLDLIAPYPAPVVGVLQVHATGLTTSYSTACEYLARFRLTWNPAEPKKLQVEPL